MFTVAIQYLIKIIVFISLVDSYNKVEGVPGALYQSYSFNCDSIKNGTARIISSHNYYQCFPYVLDLVKPTDIWVGETWYDILSTEPPPGDIFGKTVISFISLKVESFTVFEETNFHPNLQMTVEISWQDVRLTWDLEKWRFLKYPVHLAPGQQIWAPQFYVKETQHTVTLLDHFTYFDSKLLFNGNVTTKLAVRISFGHCQMNLENFPFDRVKCCFNLHMKPFDQIIINLNGIRSVWMDKSPGLYWIVDALETEIENSMDERWFKLCLGASRNTVGLSMETIAPVVVCCTLLLCAQLIGSKWKVQICVKIAALFMELLFFYALITITGASLRFSNKLPKLYYFYHLTICTTSISLLKSVLFWALIRRRLSKSVSSRCSLAVERCGSCLVGDLETAELIENDSSVKENNAILTAKTIRKKEWKNIFIVVHSIFSIIIVLFYIACLCMIFVFV